jgi:DNA-binding CsgD family transcriptional regulator
MSRMGRDPIHERASDLFSMTGVEGTSSAAANPVSSAHETRHVLPKDLPDAVKHLSDEELDRLLAVTLAEAERRGRRSSLIDKPSPKRKVEAVVSLTRGQLNAVRAAAKAGITPARIARQFGLSASQVRSALASDASK